MKIKEMIEKLKPYENEELCIKQGDYLDGYTYNCVENVEIVNHIGNDGKMYVELYLQANEIIGESKR